MLGCSLFCRKEIRSLCRDLCQRNGLQVMTMEVENKRSLSIGLSNEFLLSFALIAEALKMLNYKVHRGLLVLSAKRWDLDILHLMILLWIKSQNKDHWTL